MRQCKTKAILQTKTIWELGERARPVLGSQPTPPGTIAFRYVEDQGPLLELVPVTPYYVKEPQ